jgi:hypothetical protein
MRNVQVLVAIVSDSRLSKLVPMLLEYGMLHHATLRGMLETVVKKKQINQN